MVGVRDALVFFAFLACLVAFFCFALAVGSLAPA